MQSKHYVLLLTAFLSIAEDDARSQQEIPKLDFNGNWSVQWCDETDPEADCGGFSVDLNQVDDKISGDSFGARVRLAQVDEDGIIRGIAIGNTAVLTIESLRSGGIYLIEATVEGRCMRWKMRDTVRKAQHDIDIIATDDVLTRKTLPSGNSAAPSPEIDCRGIQAKARS